MTLFYRRVLDFFRYCSLSCSRPVNVSCVCVLAACTTAALNVPYGIGQAFCGIARGTPARSLVRPSAANMAASSPLDGAAVGALASGVAACACDGTFLFVVTRASGPDAVRQLVKLGTGYRGTEAGRMYACRGAAVRAVGAHGDDGAGGVQVLVVQGRVLVWDAASSAGMLRAYSAEDLAEMPHVRLVPRRGEQLPGSGGPLALFAAAADGAIGVFERRNGSGGEPAAGGDPPVAATATAVHAEGAADAPPEVLAADGSEPAPEYVATCDAKHELSLSADAIGGYTAGWECNVCGADGKAGTERLHCSPCSYDACPAHGVLSSSRTVMKIGRAAKWECDTCHAHGGSDVEAFFTTPPSTAARCFACAQKLLAAARTHVLPAGSVGCVLRTFSLHGDVGTESVAGKPLLWPPTARECMVGVAGDGSFDGRVGARLTPHVSAGGRPVPVACVAGNVELAIVLAATGEASYVGVPRACGNSGAAVSAPAPCAFLPARTPVVSVAVGGKTHVLFLTASGRVLSVGAEAGLGRRQSKSAKLDVELPDRVVCIAAASERSAAVLANGDLLTWGQDSGRGELAWENIFLSARRGGARKKQPTAVDAAFGVGAAGDKACAVALGDAHMVVLTASGAVHTFGSNDLCQLGRARDAVEPPGHHVLEAFGDARARAIACGSGSHTVVLSTSGEVWTFGANDYGQLGVGDCEPRTLPSRVALPGSAASVACGVQHSVALISSSVYGWGRSSEQQLASCGDEDVGRADRVVVPRRMDFGGGVPIAWCGAGGHRTFAVPAVDPLPNATLTRITVASAGAGGVGVVVPGLFRSFVTGAGGLAHDTDASTEFPPGMAPNSVVLAPDAYNGVLWALGAAEEGGAPPFMLCRFEAGSGLSAGLSCGARLLTDPRTAVPAAPDALVSPFAAVVGLLAGLEAIVMRTGTAATGATGGETSAVVPATASAATRYDVVSRYGKQKEGWSLQSKTDTVAFEVDRDVELVGVGIYGAGVDHSVVGKAWLCEGHTANGSPLSSKPYDCAAVRPGVVIPVIFDAPVRLRGGVVYSIACATAGSVGSYGLDGRTPILHEGSGVTFTFHPTKDRGHNGTSPVQGVLPEVYFRTAAAAAVPAVHVADSSGAAAVDPRPLVVEIDAEGLHSVLSLLQWAIEALRGGARSIDQSGDAQTVAVLAASTALKLLRENVRADVPEAKRLLWRPESDEAWTALLADIARLLRSAMLDLGVRGDCRVVVDEAASTFSAVFQRLYPTWAEKLACLDGARSLFLDARAAPDQSGPAAMLVAVLGAVSCSDGLADAFSGDDDAAAGDRLGDVLGVLVSEQSGEAAAAVAAAAANFVCILQSELASAMAGTPDVKLESASADGELDGGGDEVTHRTAGVRFFRLVDAVLQRVEAILESSPVGVRVRRLQEPIVTQVLPLLAAHIGCACACACPPIFVRCETFL